MDYLQLTWGVSCDESVQSHLGAPVELLPGCYRLKADTDGGCCDKTSALRCFLFNICKCEFLLRRKMLGNLWVGLQGIRMTHPDVLDFNPPYLRYFRFHNQYAEPVLEKWFDKVLLKIPVHYNVCVDCFALILKSPFAKTLHCEERISHYCMSS